MPFTSLCDNAHQLLIKTEKQKFFPQDTKFHISKFTWNF